MISSSIAIDEMKKEQPTGVVSHNVEAFQQETVREKSGTLKDAEDMQRLGRIQELRRNFSFVSISGFAMILMSTWQVLLASSAFAIPNGGTAGLLYGFIISAFFFTCVNVSMAEMASIAPTAGGQYHWISEFAPPSSQKVLSYLIGWLCTLAWQSGCAIGCFLAATQIQGLIVLNNDDYVFERWHGTLLVFAIVAFIMIFNTFLAHRLPLVETAMVFLHIGGFIGILIPLCVLGKKADSHDVWTQYENLSGWSSTGLAALVGFITPVTSLLGADAAVHMSEELRAASKTLPRVIVSTTVLNCVLGFAVLIAFVYNITNLETVISTPTGYPFIQVFYDATGSKAGATIMTLVLTLSAIGNAMTNMATASRQLWAFARDKGVPFHGWFATVNQRLEIPLNAVLFTATFTALISLINIGSVVAYNQINSLGVGALLSSYLLSIICVTLRRIRNIALPSSSFTLGHYKGLLINVLSVAFLSLVFVMSFFPLGADPNVQEMNWASLAYMSVVFLGIGYYVGKARFHYVGPVAYVRKGE